MKFLLEIVCGFLCLFTKKYVYTNSVFLTNDNETPFMLLSISD